MPCRTAASLIITAISIAQASAFGQTAGTARQSQATGQAQASPRAAQPGPSASPSFRLNPPQRDPSPAGFGGAQDTKATEDQPSDLNYELSGPYHLRSADPEPPGELVIKNIFGWSTSKDGSDDDVEYELEIEYGLVENHELIFEVPVEIGDGRVDGNADIELGWHWRLWEEQDWLPAFGMRNFVRLPTGVSSSGVDYEWIGLITKSLVPGAVRLNVNPFVKSVNGDNEEDAEHFVWGGSVGLDWRLSEDLILVGLYRLESEEIEDSRYNSTLELGADWTIAEHQKLGFGLEVSLDGDSYGPTFGATISYIIEIE